MNRELQLRDRKSETESGDVWETQRQSGKRGLYKCGFKSSVGVLFMAGREKERGERWAERENGLRQLCRQPIAYKFILLHY